MEAQTKRNLELKLKVQALNNRTAVALSMAGLLQEYLSLTAQLVAEIDILTKRNERPSENGIDPAGKPV